MAIPYSTTLITVKGRRPTQTAVDPSAEGYDPSEEISGALETAHDIRAIISHPSNPASRAQRDSGNDGEQVETAAMRCDPCDLNENDQVKDQTTGRWFEVVTAVPSDTKTFGLEHMIVKLRVMRNAP